MRRFLATALAITAGAGCAKAAQGSGDGDASVSDTDAGDGPDAASCDELCDQDDDGVPDGPDECADTASGADVNDVGCSDAQVDPTLEDVWPPYGLTWTPTGELGRAGGMVWTYTGITRADLFHIYWVLCDDPATPCAMSLDGPVDMPNEQWQFNAPSSDVLAGRLGFSNTTHITLADTTTLTLAGRMTVTIVDAADVAIPFNTLLALGVTGRDGEYGAEIAGAGYKVTALAEVYDTNAATWTPYLDYYDAAPTADPGLGTATSIGGSFYGE